MRREPDRRTAIANQDRRDGDLQPVEQIGLEEPRYRHAAAFHEHAGAAPRMQQTECLGDLVARFAAVDGRHDGVAHVTLPRRHPGTLADVQRRSGAIREYAEGRRQPPARVEDDAERIRPRHVARGEQWIVGRHGPGANEHRVAQGAQPVHVHDVVVAGDGLRIARGGCDEPVEALAEMAHRQRTGGRGAADRKVQAQHLRTGIVWRKA